MKKIIYVLLLTSCSTYDFDKFECDCSVIQEEIDEFLYEAKIRNVKIKSKPLKIVLVDYIKDGYIAATYRHKGIIKFDTTYNYDKAVVFHELAHYLLRRDHLDGTTYFQGEEVVKSIMSTRASITMEDNPYELNQYYWDELFYKK